MSNIDITYWLTVIISEILRIFNWILDLLAHITFAGTNMLNVILLIIFLTSALPILIELTRNKNQVERSSRVRRVKNEK